MPTAHDVTEATVAATAELRDHPEAVAQRLIDRWLVAFYEFDPLFERLIT